MNELSPKRPRYVHTSPADAWTPVLVAVVNNESDFARVRDEHWYRIPVRRAPQRIAAEYLALYQTGKFGAQGRRIAWYAPILRYHVLSRAELLPQEPDHPRAHEQYFKLELGDLIALPRPIGNARQPRLTFITTTLDRLLNASDIRDLWLRGAARQKLYAAVRERGLAVECWYPVNMGDRPEADLALFGPHGRIDLYIEEPDAWEMDDVDTLWEHDGVARVNALALLKDAPAVLADLIGEAKGKK